MGETLPVRTSYAGNCVDRGCVEVILPCAIVSHRSLHVGREANGGQDRAVGRRPGSVARRDPPGQFGPHCLQVFDPLADIGQLRDRLFAHLSAVGVRDASVPSSPDPASISEQPCRGAGSRKTGRNTKYQAGVGNVLDFTRPIRRVVTDR